MWPKGIIYKAGKSGLTGQVRIALPLFTRLSFYIIRGIGAGLIGFFIINALFIFGPVIREEAGYTFKDLELDYYEETSLIDPAEAESVIQVQKEADSFGINSYFSVAIPKISASANIVANVDAARKDEYLQALKKGVAHAKGTFFPGQGESIFLFAHSTDSPVNIARYNAVFYLLRKLEKGDEVIIYFADKKYVYEVEEKVIAESGDTSWLANELDEERLLLMTCDPPGTTWRRLIVVAKPI